jgi:hypothetical protein
MFSARTLLGWGAAASLVATTALPLLADGGVTAMCLALSDEAACSCATERLRQDVGAEDFAVYDTIGVDYTSRRAGGEAMADAWEAASGTVAAEIGLSTSELRQRTNAVGRAHRDAIRGCEG